MAKGRHLKPEIWTDDKFVSLTPLARLLFMGMWNYACDNGHVEDNVVQLKMRLLPMDNADVAALRVELIDSGMVVSSGPYLKVVNLAEHQRIDLRYLLLCEHCDVDGDAVYTADDRPASTRSPRRAPRGSTQGARRAPAGDTTSAQGVHATDGDGDGDGDGDVGAAAAAHAPAAAAAPDLPINVQILRQALEAHHLWVRWDILTAAEIAEVGELVDRHGDGPLIKSALVQHQPAKPAATARAWLPAWRDLRAPGDLALVKPDPCPLPGHQGSVTRCAQCASEQKAAR